MDRHASWTESSSVREPNYSPEKYHAGLFLPDKVTAQEAGWCSGERVVQRSEGVLTIALLTEDQRLLCPATGLPQPPQQAVEKWVPLCSPRPEPGPSWHGTEA